MKRAKLDRAPATKSRTRWRGAFFLGAHLSAFAAILSACTTESRGGGTDGDVGGDKSGASTDKVSTGEVDATKPCGEPGGPVCEVGARCAPGGIACQQVNVGMRCQELGTDCKPLAVPVCEEHGSCGVGAVQSLACSCTGTVVSSGCAPQAAADPALCSTGVFPCGETSCRNWIDVCILSEPSGAAPHCVSARKRGCETYGVNGCDCLSVEAGQKCEMADGGQTVIKLSEEPEGGP